jgi:hypothetical protein
MTAHSIDALLSYMPVVMGRGDGWSRAFAASIMKQARRPGWAPSPKQLAMMRALVTELFAMDGDELFERTGDDE